MMVHGVPQLDLVVTKDGREFSNRYCSHQEHSIEAICPDTYMLSSISKTITAFSVINFADTLGIALTDSVLAHLPVLSKCSNISNNVRIVDLLGHTAGINSVRFNWASFSPDAESRGVLESFDRGEYCFSINVETLGSWTYSSIAYDILGALIEAKSGATFSDFITDNVLHKLGMNDSYFSVDQIPTGKLAHPTIFDHGEVLKIQTVPNAARHRPSAVMFSTANDLSKWGRYVASRGTSEPGLKSENSVFDLMWSKRTYTGIDYCPHYGLGWFIGDWAANIVVGHGGRESGFNTLLLAYPDSDISITILMNTHIADVIRLAAEISRCLIKAKALKAQFPADRRKTFFPPLQ